ncbi:hypothetical protein [Ruminococcus sp.]|uniref:hypothetical protein n=1 Tax=Ruminococcus sp. TaxID=41978 RepID=UPI0025F0D287|nr:hypothetical protein [Ruminococcus sp.]MBQ8967215.1 hypothetical protein [Ruminococcus sp.]
MKKILAMTLALSLAALTFASCGDTASDSKADETTTTTTAAAEESSEEEAESEAPAETEAPAESEAEETEAPAESEAEEEGEGEAAEPAEFDITKVTGYDENATETVFELTDQISDAWGSSFGSDFIDARSFDRDKDIHMVVDFEYVESYNQMIEEGVTDQHKTQIVIGPSRANGWSKFGETFEGLITDYPSVNDPDLTDYVVANGEDLATPETKDNKPKIEQEWPDVFVKGDGFIKIGNHDVKQIEFTIPAEEVNKLIDNAFTAPTDDADTEHGWDGVLFQLGGNMYLTKITIDQGNVFMNSTIIDSGM